KEESAEGALSRVAAHNFSGLGHHFATPPFATIATVCRLEARSLGAPVKLTVQTTFTAFSVRSDELRPVMLHEPLVRVSTVVVVEVLPLGINVSVSERFLSPLLPGASAFRRFAWIQSASVI